MKMVAWSEVSFSSFEIILTLINTASMTYLYFKYLQAKSAYANELRDNDGRSLSQQRHRSNRTQSQQSINDDGSRMEPSIPSMRPFSNGRGKSQTGTSSSSHRNISEQLGFEEADEDEHLITSLDQLRAITPSGFGGTSLLDAPKVIQSIDEQMQQFVESSPLVFLATASCNYNDNDMYPPVMPFCSPKGGAPGFCKIHKPTRSTNNGAASDEIWIPDTPGNQILFGLQNILQNTGISLCFVIPNNTTTLRVMGQAVLTTNPRILRQLSNSSTDVDDDDIAPKLAIRIKVEHAFFHCGRSFTQSKVWNEESWPQQKQDIDWGVYFPKMP